MSTINMSANIQKINTGSLLEIVQIKLHTSIMQSYGKMRALKSQPRITLNIYCEYFGTDMQYPASFDSSSR